MSKSPLILLLGAEPKSLLNFRRPLIEAMVRAGLRVAVASMQPAEAQRQALEALGAEVHAVSLARAGMNPVKDFATLIALYRLMARLRPDGVIAYTAKPVIYGLIAAWMARVPRRAALITGLGYSFIDGPERSRQVARQAARFLYGRALPRATAILFQNTDDRQTFADLGLLPKHLPVSVVNGSGVDTEHFAPAAFPASPVFLMIARLLADKGVREYAEAAAELRRAVPGAKTLLVGGLDPSPNAVSEEELKSFVSGGLDYRGELADVRLAIAESSVMVLPSYREGTPRSVLEAMSMGRAVITTDAPGCRETVTDGKNGILVPVRNAAALAAAMIELGRNHERAAAMGQTSRRLALEKYEAGRVAVDTLTKAGMLPGNGAT